MRGTLICALIAAATVACAGSPIEPLPFDASVEASRTAAAPGDTISFVVNAQGGALLGVEIDYGDSTDDIFGTAGARTARVTFRHAYQTSGTFVVRVVVTDAGAGQKEATVEVRVN